MIKTIRTYLADKKNLMLFVVFIVICAFNFHLVINHECWRDEAQAWLIARDCTLTADSLFTVTAYEGHPALWFLILMPFAKLGAPYYSLKFISLLFVSLALAVFLFATKLPAWFKILFSFTPIFIGFYAVPARTYSFCAVLIMLIAVLYPHKEDKPILFGIVLALQLQTLTIMGGFVVGCCIYWFAETIYFNLIKNKDVKKLLLNGVGLFLPLLSAIFLLWEFRYIGAVVGGNSIGSVREMAAAIVYAIIEGAKALYGNYGVLMMFAAFLILGYIAVSEKCNIGPFLILLIGFLWQCYIYAYVYSNGNHRVLLWGYMVLWDVAVAKIPNITVHTGYKYVIVLLAVCLMWNYEYTNDLIRDLNPHGKYADTTGAANAINELPNDAIIFEISDEYCNGVLPYLGSGHKVYNPFTKSVATYADRIPENKTFLTYDEFLQIAKEMFPDAEKIYVMLALESNRIRGIYDQTESDGVTTYYENTRDEFIMYDQYKIIEINMKMN